MRGPVERRAPRFVACSVHEEARPARHQVSAEEQVLERREDEERTERDARAAEALLGWERDRVLVRIERIARRGCLLALACDGLGLLDLAVTRIHRERREGALHRAREEREQHAGP